MADSDNRVRNDGYYYYIWRSSWRLRSKFYRGDYDALDTYRILSMALMERFVREIEPICTDEVISLDRISLHQRKAFSDACDLVRTCVDWTDEKEVDVLPLRRVDVLPDFAPFFGVMAFATQLAMKITSVRERRRYDRFPKYSDLFYFYVSESCRLFYFDPLDPDK